MCSQFLTRFRELNPDADANSFLLLGGFAKWLTAYKDSPKDHVDEYDASVWVLDTFGHLVHTTLLDDVAAGTPKNAKSTGSS